jgi:hypothetical protein
MKTLTTSLPTRMLAAFLGALVGLFGLATVTFAANPVFNTDNQDCPTVTVARYQNEQSSVCWQTSETASDGDYVNVAIYYHNTGTSPATGVNVYLNDPGDGEQQSFSFTGGIRYNGQNVAPQNTATLQLSQPGRLVLMGAYKHMNGQDGNTALANPQSLLDNGFNPETVGLGWANQGVLKFKFRVEIDDNGCTNCDNDNPDVTTISATNITSSSAKLRGELDSNGDDTWAWFKWGQEGEGLDETTSQVPYGEVSNSAISATITGLSDGDYEFQACARHAGGPTICGSVLDFTIGDGDDDLDTPSVTTDSASSIDEDSATLRGTLDDDGGDDNLHTWFEWGTSSGNLNNSVSAQSIDDDGDDFSKNITGLQSDRTYYFRACAENDSDEDCGSVKQFRTDDEDDNICTTCDDTQRPSVTTLPVINRGSSFASADGYFSANGCSATTWFQFGTTQNLGTQTTQVNRGNTSGSMAQLINNLAANTTYYYRAVAQNCEGISYGSILSFTTLTGGTGPIVPPTIITTGGGGGSFIRLMITNNQETVSAGEELTYEVTWENISGRDLEDLLLEVTFPASLRITDTDDGDIDAKENRVIIEIPSLDAREIDETTIDTTVRGTLRQGDPVVARAIIAFENPTTQARENAIGYDSDTYSARNGGLGAFLFGAGFFPTTLAGWLIILLIILGIIYLARRYMRHEAAGMAAAAVTTPVVPVTPAGEYTAYRPMPRQ